MPRSSSCLMTWLTLGSNSDEIISRRFAVARIGRPPVSSVRNRAARVKGLISSMGSIRGIYIACALRFIPLDCQRDVQPLHSFREDGHTTPKQLLRGVFRPFQNKGPNGHFPRTTNWLYRHLSSPCVR